MYSTSAILFIISFFLILTIIGFVTLFTLFVQATRRFWRGLYRMAIYLYKRSSGYPERDAMNIAISH
ncbi:hypothetical protein H9L19_01770 [Weissella diestrammenae]|uniref:Uncharacterized protein n=1 Tax=Weissella diestrammenae TaxID=1162633 RepID=A0A7G9T6A3_9LACO|nr:hypothetical protein [Weissella diestrammenae]MCM0583326.1 hypothetical protein [Weissella diestrammenae]QNN75628.1 hypothetical protein H9L19_01770 [Weissella diestrammenae]